MRTRILNTLLLAALVVAVVRLWLFLGEPPSALPAIVAGPAPAVTATKTRKIVEVAEFRPETFDVIAARDLFSPSRGAAPALPAAAAVPAAKPQPPPRLTLSGVVVLDGEKTAFLQEGTQEGRPRKVRENENFAGGVVKTIRSDGITFLFAGSEINVPLRTPKTGAEAPSPRSPVVGGVPPRSDAAGVFPRRPPQPGAQPGMMPAPNRPVIAPPGMPSVVLPVEPGSEIFGDEEFPEGPLPEMEMPGMMEGATGE